jgi:hypothetical protein
MGHPAGIVESRVIDVDSLLSCYTPPMLILRGCLIALGAFGVLLAQNGSGSIDPPVGVSAALQAKGDGVQVYTCTAANDGQRWVLKGPDAKLLDAAGKTIGSHFAGPTWKLDDGSQVQGELIASQPSPEAKAVAWLLLRAKVGSATGTLAQIKFIRRTETEGGVAPESGCVDSHDVGKTVRVPYTATYTFYAEK